MATAFVALFAWTWGTWPDVTVDFGRELYVPWRLTEGAQLFRDLAWFNGPLSPEWNALMFRVFGVGLSTLVWVNALLFAATLALLHGVLRAISSPSAATIACVVVIATCGFGQLVGIGNYNYICPYSHEATHGVLLGLAALNTAQHWRGRGAIKWVLASGFCVGLAFLTKPEMFLAALAGAGASVVLHAWSARFAIPRALGVFALGALTPLVLSWTLLSGALGSRGAWVATLGAWPRLASSEVTSLDFYRAAMGTDAPGENALALLFWTLGIVAVLSPSLLCSLWARNERVRTFASSVAALATIAIFAGLFRSVRWLQAARPWPLFALVALVANVAATLRHRGNAKWPGSAAFAAFALTMLAKMVLKTRIAQYGFALAMPATALIVVMLWSWIPQRLDGARFGARTFQAGVAAAFACFAAIHLARTAPVQRGKTVEVGSGADRFRSDVRGKIVNATLAWLEQRAPANAARPTLAVFPEGVTLNYLARLRNPTPYVNFMPPEIMLFGEEHILDALRSAPPDIVLLVHKDTSEYGARWFGRDYAPALGDWLRTSYRRAQRFGDPPLQAGSRFGIDVLVPKDP